MNAEELIKFVTWLFDTWQFWVAILVWGGLR